MTRTASVWPVRPEQTARRGRHGGMGNGAVGMEPTDKNQGDYGEP
jgi:hypothetical protein